MRRIPIWVLAGLLLTACTLGPPGTGDTLPGHVHKDADTGGPQRPMYIPADGVMKKSGTRGKVGDDAYVCADKACKTAIKVK